MLGNVGGIYSGGNDFSVKLLGQYTDRVKPAGDNREEIRPGQRVAGPGDGLEKKPGDPDGYRA